MTTSGLNLAQTLLAQLQGHVSQSKTIGLTKIYKAVHTGLVTEQFLISRKQIQLVRADSYVYMAKKAQQNIQAQLTDILAMRHSFFSAADSGQISLIISIIAHVNIAYSFLYNSI